MKKILAIVLAVVMLLPVFAVNVFAADTANKNLVITSGRVTLKLADVVKAGESVEIHLAGTTDGAFRMYLSDAASKGGSWDQSEKEVVSVANGRLVDGAFDFTATIKANSDAQYLLISTGAAYQLDNEEPFKNLVVETVEANGAAVDLGTLDISNGAAKLEDKPLEEVVAYDNPEGIALADAKNPWDFFGMGGLWGREAATVLDSVSNDQLKEILNAGGYTFTYVCGNASGWSGTPKAVFNGNFDNSVPFKTKDIGDGKYECTIKLDTVVSKWTSLGKTIDEITSFVIQHDLGNIVLYSAKFIPGTDEEFELIDLVTYELNCGDGKTLQGWNDTGVSAAQFVNAISKEGSKLVIETELNGDWAQLQMQATGWKAFHVADLGTGKIEITPDEILAKIQAVDPSFTLADIIQVCSNGGPITFKSFKVITPTLVPVGEKKTPVYDLAFIYVNEELHAYSLGSIFIPMPHVDNGFGYCKHCREVMPATDDTPKDEVIYNLEKTGGQDAEGATVADGLLLEDKQEGKGNCRIATNWVSGGTAWNMITKSLPTEGAWLKVTYTGDLKSVIFQTEKTSAPEAFEITEPTLIEEGEQNVAWFNCADIVANSPVAMSGDIGGWANFMLNFEGETTLYGFEIIVPLVEPGTAVNVEAA